MIEHQGIFLPDGERHLIEWMNAAGEIVDGRGTYQIKKLRRALSYVKQFRTAIDVGAHVGLWTMQLVKQFHTVYAFEPVEAHRECLRKNINGFSWQEIGGSNSRGVIVHSCAISDHEGVVHIHTNPTSSGDSWIDGSGDIPIHTLDSFELTNIDFIKLDCEGYELFALRGGEETIKRDRPVIIVEQKPGRAQKFGLPERGAVDYLQSLGYRMAEELSGDFIMVPT